MDFARPEFLRRRSLLKRQRLKMDWIPWQGDSCYCPSGTSDLALLKGQAARDHGQTIASHNNGYPPGN